MSKSKLDSTADFISDHAIKFSDRREALARFSGHLRQAFSFGLGPPDLKYALKIFNDIAKNPDEALELRRSAIHDGIQPAIVHSAEAFQKAKVTAAAVPEAIHEFGETLRTNIGDPDLILSQILDIAEDENPLNPLILREQFFHSAKIICSNFNRIGHDSYTLPDQLKERFAKLEYLEPSW